MFSADVDKFRFGSEFADGFKDQRVFITGSGKDGGIGQSFALAAAMNGAESVGVHFHSSYQDAFDLVEEFEKLGVNAFPVQADVTNPRDMWATRSYIIDQMGGKPPSLLICNSGLTESGYSFGRALRPVEDESVAMRRARVRQHFIDSLDDSRRVLDTKIDGFMASTHLWAGEAVYHEEPLRIVYVSSRQAIDPGPAVPGYAISNWAVLQLPQVLEVNLGRSAHLINSFSVMFPFIRTGMTDEYADNEKVFGRWQPRMLETHECAEAFAQLLCRSDDELRSGMFELMVDRADEPEESDEPAEATGGESDESELIPVGDINVTWRHVKLNIEEASLQWSEDSPRRFATD